MGRMDATLFVHPAQLMAVIQKKEIKLTVNSTAQKKTVILKKWVEYKPNFWRLKCGPIG